MINSASVSKDGRNAGTRGHPSRRAQGRAPQDEVGDIFTTSFPGDDEWDCCRWPKASAPIVHPSGFSPASIAARRGSRNGGSARFSPSVSIGSPGGGGGPPGG